MVPSPRSSPAIRPTSPMSPRYEPSRFEAMMLQPPSPRGVQARGGGVRNARSAGNSLRLPQLPRFHPANFPSAHSSYQSTPEDEHSSRAPLSPRSHLKMYSEAQKQLFVYHRDSVTAARATSPLRDRPEGPRLVPIGSPGAITPLELEMQDEYLLAGLKSTAAITTPSRELVDTLIQKEVRHLTSVSPSSLRSSKR